MSEPITIIGSNTVVNGNLEGDEDLTVEGRVEGSINLSRTLTIEVGGVVRANINVRNAVISGVLVGNIEAQESVHLTEQGRVVGDIAAPRVILVDGASFRGNIDMGEFDVDAAPIDVLPRAAAPAVEYREEEPAEEEAEEPKIERPAPTRVRPAAAPARRATPTRPVATRAPAAAKPKPAPRPAPKPAEKKKRPPAPKVRSVGKTKATKKKRA